MGFELLVFFDESRGSAIPNPMVMGVKEFAALIERDKSKHKKRACAEFAYIFHMGDPTSPYTQYEEKLREVMVIKHFLPDGWLPDGLVQDALKVYKELNVTPSGRLLEGGLVGIHKLKAFFEEVDLNALDKAGRPIYKPSDIMGPIKDLPKAVQAIMELTEQVASEKVEGGVNKGGVETNKYSE